MAPCAFNLSITGFRFGATPDRHIIPAPAFLFNSLAIKPVICPVLDPPKHTHSPILFPSVFAQPSFVIFIFVYLDILL
jgi:hypothetical protein